MDEAQRWRRPSEEEEPFYEDEDGHERRLPTLTKWQQRCPSEEEGPVYEDEDAVCLPPRDGAVLPTTKQMRGAKDARTCCTVLKKPVSKLAYFFRVPVGAV